MWWRGEHRNGFYLLHRKARTEADMQKKGSFSFDRNTYRVFVAVGKGVF